MLSRRSFIAAAATTAGTSLLLGQALNTRASASTPTLPLSLQNNSGNSTVYAYITGSDSTGWPGFVDADGQFNRLPNPSSTLTPTADHSIQLGPSGSAATNITLQEYVISGRVWFSTSTQIQFFVNPGNPPLLVQPFLAPSDPNWQTDWTFCEFTFNSTNLYANLSYVDLVASPISIQTTGGLGQQTVGPLPSGALTSIASGLIAQHAADGAPWDQLVSTDSSGNVLRVISPFHSPTDFGSYWDNYVSSVWSNYESNSLTIDTQGTYGAFTGTVANGELTFAGLDTNGVPFTQPAAIDIFSCASGPLYNSGGDARDAVAVRLAAALNRSTLLVSGGNNQPSGDTAAQYYQDPTTNHYARLVHQYATVGYAFPDDDVLPTGASPVDGHVQDSAPTSCTISFGGPVGGGSSSSAFSAFSTSSPFSAGSGFSASSSIQASNYSANSGTQTQACSDTGGGINVGWINAGCWLKYSSVNFGAASPAQFIARLASGAPAGVTGAVEVHLDNVTGTTVAVIDIGNTGGWQNWETVPMNLSGSVTGVHDVYLVFNGSTLNFVNVNWFTFQ